MRYDYEYGYQTLPNTMDDESVMMVLGVFLAVFGVILVCCLIGWILHSIGLYSMAKRRGIRKPWLSWIPVGNYWILGSLSDQYQHLVEGKVKSRRKLLLILSLASMVIGVFNGIFSGLLSADVLTEEQAGTFVLLSSIPSILSAVIGIVTLVFYHMCNYDVYRSCDPKNAVAFLVIGIIFGVTEPFFYFFNRKKDLGFVRPEPVEVVMEPYEEPVPAEPVQLPEAEQDEF